MSNPSPLSEPDPRALDEIFNMDPLALTKDDAAVDRLILELRSQRERWEKAEKSKKGKPPAQVVSTLSLEDLGIKL